MADRTTTKIGSYQILDVLGEGRHGQMFLAADPEGNRVAIKCLKLDHIIDDKAMELFQREMGVLAHLHHPAIPRLLDSGLCDDGMPYLVQQYVRGENLAEAVQKGLRFDDREAEQLARNLLDALRYLHGLHPPVIHRDIKPDNIILTHSGPILVDFGAVCGKALLKGEASGTIVGTLGYMAPEMLKGIASPASDLYSLGATLLCAFSGREPDSFPNKRLKILFRDSLNLPDPLANLLEALLEPAAEDRPQSAADALRMLDEGLSEAGEGKEMAEGALISGGQQGRMAEKKRQSTQVRPRSRRITTLKVFGVAGGLLLIGLFVGLGPAAFAAWAKSILLGAGILVLIVLIILTFVGGF
ncbi:MAG: serine/threonine protein kinase [Bradymonadales bacterium]|nr:serine/threonine protein kinase [Bradymonadales bacterium]